MTGFLRLFQAVTLCASLMLVGCGGEPYTYQTDRELKPGPGLLSGEDGVFRLYGMSERERQELRKQQEEQRQKEDSADQNGSAGR
jgi:hypothetical protein